MTLSLYADDDLGLFALADVLPPAAAYVRVPDPCFICAGAAVVDVTGFVWNAHGKNLNNKPDRNYRCVGSRAEGFACPAHIDEVTDHVRDVIAERMDQAYMIWHVAKYPYVHPDSDHAALTVELVEP